MSDLDNRRPIAARDTGIARYAARRLAGVGVSANAVSAASVVFALVAAAAILSAPAGGPVVWLAAAGFIGLRLLANLFDGMVAIEHG
ncbi:MAG: CDP-alcohol phosphatidyltransferase family protein, partial [Pseudomonadota bacterium]